MAGVEVAELAHFIKRNAIAGHDPHFLIKEENDNDIQPQEIRIDSIVLNRMIDKLEFRIDAPVSIRQPNKATATDISLCFTRGTSYPISGFPRKLHSERVASIGAYDNLTQRFLRFAHSTGSEPSLPSVDQQYPLGRT